MSVIDDRCGVCRAMGGYGLGTLGAMRWYCRAHRPAEWFALEKKEAPEGASIGSVGETTSTAEPQAAQQSLWDSF